MCLYFIRVFSSVERVLLLHGKCQQFESSYSHLNFIYFLSQIKYAFSLCYILFLKIDENQRWTNCFFFFLLKPFFQKVTRLSSILPNICIVKGEMIYLGARRPVSLKYVFNLRYILFLKIDENQRWTNCSFFFLLKPFFQKVTCLSSVLPNICIVKGEMIYLDARKLVSPVPKKNKVIF